MIVTASDADGLKRVFRVRIPAGDMSARLDRRIEEMRGGLRLKGFRPGKVPASHIRRIYGRSMMEEEVRSVVGESSRTVIEDNKLRPAMNPDVNMVSDTAAVVSGASDLEFDLELEVMPEMTIASLSELRLIRYTADVPAQEINQALSSLAESAATTHPASDGYRAGPGDVCVVSYQGRINGEAFAGGDATDDVIAIGGKRHLPEFEQALVGKCADEDGRVEIVFPQDYGARDLRGQTAMFSFQVKEVRLRKIPPVDDALAVSLGLKTLSELEQAVAKRLQTRNDMQARRALEKAALNWLDDQHRTIVLPGKLVDHEYQQMWKHGPEDARAQASEDDKATLRAEAERRVRLGLVLAEVGSAAGIEVRKAELDQAMHAELARRGQSRDQALAYLRDHPEAVDQMRAPIYEGKVINYIIERADVTTMALSFTEFQKKMRDEGSDRLSVQSADGGLE